MKHMESLLLEMNRNKCTYSEKFNSDIFGQIAPGKIPQRGKPVREGNILFL